MLPREEKDRIIASVQSNNGFMREFVADYLEEIPQDIQAIEDAILQRDADRLERSAHGIKSVVGLFQAMIPYEISRDIEQCGKESDFVAATEKLKQLRAALGELNALLATTL